MMLSVIIIARNESSVIEKCLKSVFKACNKDLITGNYEIIVVDSNSTDDTVKIATKVLRESKAIRWKVISYESTIYTAALGREIGRSYATAEYLLFMDGDMILYSSFIEKFKKSSMSNKIAGVVGKRIDIRYSSDDKPMLKVWKRRKNQENLTLYPGGCFLVNSSCINNIHFNVEQKSKEEESFAKKLAEKGFFIKYLDHNMYLHLNYKITQRNFKTRLRMIKDAASCIVNSIIIHCKDYGLYSTIRFYLYELINYTVTPITLIIFFIFSLAYGGIFYPVFYLGLILYIGFNKLHSLIFFYQFFYIFIKKEVPKFKVNKILKSKSNSTM